MKKVESRVCRLWKQTHGGLKDLSVFVELQIIDSGWGIVCVSVCGGANFRAKVTRDEHGEGKGGSEPESLVRKSFNLLDTWDGYLEAFFTEGIKPYWRRCQFKIRKEESIKLISMDTCLFLRRHVQAPMIQSWVLIYKNLCGSDFKLSNASSSLFSELS